MSYMRGDLLTKTRKAVMGLAKREPLWLKPMENAPPAVFPRFDGKVKAISFPEDVYVTKFYQKHPESKYEDPIKLGSFHPVPSRIFASRVLELKEQGVREEDAMAVADMEYQTERTAKKKAYTRLKQISRVLGKKPPNPYPSAIKEIQAEERPYVRERFFDPQILDMVKVIKEERRAEDLRFGRQNFTAGQERFGRQERLGGQERFLGRERMGGRESFGGQERFVRGERMGGQESFVRGERIGRQGSSVWGKMMGGQESFVQGERMGGLGSFGGQERFVQGERMGGQERSGGLESFVRGIRMGGQERSGGQEKSGGLDSLADQLF